MRASIYISEDLNVVVCVDEKRLPSNIYKTILPNNQIETFSQISNLMALVKSWITSSASIPWLEIACSCLKQYLESEGNSEDKQNTVEFVLEQLQLLSVNKHARRYSSALLLFSYAIFSTSPAAFRFIFQQGVLLLPSTSTLKKVTRTVDSSVDNVERLLDKNILRERLFRRSYTVC